MKQTSRAPDFAGITVNENTTETEIPLVNSAILVEIFDSDGPDRNSVSDQANNRLVAGSTGVYDVSLAAQAGAIGNVKIFEVYAYFVDPLAGTAITGATKADPVVVSSAAHGLSDGNECLILGVATMVELNSRIFKVADKAAGTIELTDNGGASPANDIDGSGFAGAGTGGTLYLAERTAIHLHRKYQTAGDIGSTADSFLVQIPAGCWLVIASRNVTDDTNIIYEHVTLTMNRID